MEAMQIRNPDVLIHPYRLLRHNGFSINSSESSRREWRSCTLTHKLSAMTSTGRGRGATYAESTKLQIIRAVLRQPGCTGRQIAESLGLDRSRVN